MGFGVIGPQTQPLRVPAAGGNRLWGVRFWPGIAPSVVPFPPETLRNGLRMSSSAEIGAWLETARAVLSANPSEFEAMQAWESSLFLLLAQPPTPDDAVLGAVAAILDSRGAVKIGDLAASVGLSSRQLRRRFRLATGLNPKELARISRVRSSLIEALFRDEWAAIATAHGFTDQSHLVHEYQRLVGDTPSGLLRYLRGIRHEGIDRRSAFMPAPAQNH